MTSIGTGRWEEFPGRKSRRLLRRQAKSAWLGMAIVLCIFPAASRAQSERTDRQAPGRISGTIVDRTGAVVAGARVKLTRDGNAAGQEVATGDDGQFTFADIAAGPFQITITASGLATQVLSGTLHSGETYVVPQVTLAVATAVAEVEVSVPLTEVAEEEIKEQEKQRVFGFIPNFYVSYVPNAAPLGPKQKFQLAWKSSIDPVTFGMVGVIAGVQQATDGFSGYGQGAEGYAKRYGATYGDFVTSTFIGGAILPSLFKQDPRYFYKGTGTKRSRVLYAIANSVICKGDNGRWQANYSGILGSLAAGGISYSYYPDRDRGAALVFENTLVGIGETAAINLLQEFLVRKLTPNLPNHDPSKP